MMKQYNGISIEVLRFDCEDIITTSSNTQLKDGGASGTGASESYNSLFGE